MAHILAPEAESDLDDIWLYVARETGSLETADRLIDSLTEPHTGGALNTPEL